MGSAFPPIDPSLAREATILSNMDLVWQTALKIRRRLAYQVELDELVGDGFVGLVHAVDHFDPSREVGIRTYAEIRIRGAMLDAQRSRDWVPRSTRKENARIEGARTTLRSKLGREPLVEELASALNMSSVDFVRARLRHQLLRVEPLDQPVGSGSFSLADLVATDEGEDPEARMARAQRVLAVRAAMVALSEPERTVLRLYHQQEDTMREVAATMRLSEGEVTRLRRCAEARLRRALAEHKPRGAVPVRRNRIGLAHAVGKRSGRHDTC